MICAEDTEIVEESFLEDVANMLSSGEVPNLFTGDELSAVRANLEKAGKDQVARTELSTSSCTTQKKRSRCDPLSWSISWPNWVSWMRSLSLVSTRTWTVLISTKIERMTCITMCTSLKAGSKDCPDSGSDVWLLHLPSEREPSHCKALRCYRMKRSVW